MIELLDQDLRAELVEAVRDHLAGDRPRAVLVGDPGIGKTTLLAEVLAATKADWSWQAHCLESEAELGLAVLASMFEAVPEEVLATLPQPQRQAVDVVLYRISSDGGGVTDGLLGATTLGILRGLLACGTAHLAIDDVHWCDPTSLTALRFALARVDDPDLAVVVTARTALVPVLPDVTEFAVLPLDVATTHKLVRSLAPSASGAAVAGVVEQSAGNPFFATELARTLASGVDGQLPESLRTALKRRLDALPAATRATLLDLAIRGDADQFELSVTDLDTAFRAGIVVISAARIRFAHPLLASGSIDLATPDEVRQARMRAAAVASDPIMRAVHRGLSEPPSEELAAELDVAVQLAKRRADWTGARRLASLALDATPAGARPSARVIELAEAKAIVEARAGGSLSVAVPDAQEVMRTTTSGDEIVRAAKLLEGPGSPAEHANRYAQLARRPELSAANVRELVTLESGERWRAGDIGGAIALLDGALDGPHDAAWTQLVGFGAYLRRMNGRPVDLAMLREAADVERAINAEHGIGDQLDDAMGAAAVIAYFDDRHDEAVELLNELELLTNQFGWPSNVEHYYGLLLARTGHLSDAISSLTTLCDVHGRSPSLVVRLGMAVVWTDAERTRDIIAECERSADLREFGNALLCFLKGFDAVLDGRPQQAWPPLQQSLDLVHAEQVGEPSLVPAVLVGAEVALAVGEVEIARALCDELADSAERLAHRWAAAGTKRLRGLIAAAHDDSDGAERFLEDSARDFVAIDVPLEAVRSQLALGALLRRLGRRRDARAVLQTASETAARCGADRLVAAGNAELARLGGRRPAVSTDELTEAERQVAQLAAQGRRNKEIAGALHISTKTVEAHLGRIFRKLSVTNRAELATRLSADS